MHQKEQSEMAKKGGPPKARETHGNPEPSEHLESKNEASGSSLFPCFLILLLLYKKDTKAGKDGPWDYSRPTLRKKWNPRNIKRFV